MSVWMRRAALLGALLAPLWATAQDEAKASEDQATAEEESKPDGSKASDSADRDDDEASVTYSGIGLSRVSTDFDNLKEAVNLEGVLGIRVPNLDWIAAEINLSVSIIPGENRGGTAIIGGSDGNCISENPPLPPGCTPASEGQQVTTTGDDFQMQLIGAYLVLRSPGRFYATGKLGYGYQITSIRDIDERERSGSVYTVGGGWRYGKGLGGVELLYSRFLSDVDAIGFSVTYGFGGRRDRDRD
ncbi:hypothetical protein [Sinimarinibacterium thermocellulolyticum]|uniref:Outer membrane protein beta-barrel domain-containing protein n=1 Tax=Sinimarinibacterium thermocellulolyticum TaxID=3170016 RepID=A0ABV2ACP4_9GAMM